MKLKKVEKSKSGNEIVACCKKCEIIKTTANMWADLDAGPFTFYCEKCGIDLGGINDNSFQVS
jgi:hypothetical protein